MFKKVIKFSFKLACYLAMVGFLVVFITRLITGIFANKHIKSVDDVEASPVAIVFGAGLWRDGTPTPVLRDRVAVAADLYFSGKVEKLLMSGDNRFVDYNEPAAMRDYALSLGVPEADIVLDYAGRRTYDTCYRAKAIFGLEKAILVTQQFHLPRALYTCQILGVAAEGVVAEGHYYLKRSRLIWNLRELFATPVALWEVHVSRPIPILGDPEPIFGEYAVPLTSGKLFWREVK